MSSYYARANDGAERRVEPAALALRERFDGVVQRHRGSVTLAAYHITENIEDARDVAQHVFMQLFRKRLSFNDQRSLRRWLYVVTRNAALSTKRWRQRDDIAASLTSEDAVQLGLEDTVLQNERSRQVRAMIALLPSADRAVIELRYLQAFSTAEIAMDLGITVRRVKRDVERAKWRLRNEMLRQGVAEEVR
jgi:RNA polymerase sigma-70 factor (ECF subfamily)